MKKEDVQSYITLIEGFLFGHITAKEFETRYLKQFKEDNRIFPDGVFTILNGVFTDCDAFNSNPALRGPNDLDEQQLLASCRTACERLQAIGDSERK
jgi:hypothetical protein